MASENEGKAKEEGAGGAAADALTPPTMQYGSDPHAGSEMTMKMSPGEQRTIQQQQNTMPGPQKTMQQPPSGAPVSPLSAVSASSPSGKTHLGSITNEVGPQTLAAGVTLQDLSGERLLLAAPRLEYQGRTCPSLGGIAILSKIGQGGMGAVYYGVHPRLRSEVAVKVLPFHLAEQDPGMIRRFFREAQLAAQVRSPHLVNVMDVNEEAGLFFLVMEFVSGRTAGQYLKDILEKGAGGLPELDALDLTLAASEGLWTAHANNIVHRDVKPENIMIPYVSKTSKEFDLKRAKLMDLGLARSEDTQQSLTGAQAAMGTPGYMAPEQAMDAKSADKRSDVFSMGASLYALLVGRPPFKGETVMKVLMATMHEPHEPIIKVRPDISPAINEVLEKCLAKKQEHRYADARQLLNALNDCRVLLTGAGGAGALSAGRTFVYPQTGGATAAPAPGSGTEKTLAPGATTPAAAQPAAKKGVLYIGAGVAAVLVIGAAFFVFGGKKDGATDPGAKTAAGEKVEDKTAKPAMDPDEFARLTKRHTKFYNDAKESLTQGDPDEAKFTLETLMQKLGLTDPESKKREAEIAAACLSFGKKKEFDKLMKEADSQYAHGDLEKALETINLAATKAPDAVATQAADAKLKKIMGEIKTKRNSDRAGAMLAEAKQLQADKPEQARDKVDELLKLVPDKEDGLHKEAAELRRKLDSIVQEQIANDKYNKIIKEVEAAFTAQNYTLAGDKALDALTLLPGRPEASDWQKKIGEKLGEAKKAEMEALAKKQRDEQFAKAMSSADDLLKKGQLDAALDSVKTALAVTPGNEGALAFQKRVQTSLDEQKKSEATQRKQREFDGLMAEANRILADAEGNPDDAARRLADARKVFPDDTQKVALVEAAEKKAAARKQELKAKADYEKLVDEARTARKDGELDKAQKLVEDAVKSPLAANDARLQSIKRQVEEALAARAEEKRKLQDLDAGYIARLAKAGDYEKTGDAAKADAYDEKLGQYRLALKECVEAKALKQGGDAEKRETALKQKLTQVEAAQAEATRKRIEAERKAAAEQATMSLRRQQFDQQVAQADAAAKQGNYTDADKHLDGAKAILNDEKAQAVLAAKAEEYKRARGDVDKAVSTAYGAVLDTMKKGDLAAAAGQMDKLCTAHPGRADIASVRDTLQTVQKADARIQTQAEAAGSRYAEFAKNKKLEGKPELQQLAIARDKLRGLTAGVLTELATSNFKDAAGVVRKLEQDAQTAGAQVAGLCTQLEALARKDEGGRTRPDTGEQRIDDDKPKPRRDEKPTPPPRRSNVGEMNVD